MTEFVGGIRLPDYCLLAFSLLLSVGTGVYHAFRSHRLVSSVSKDGVERSAKDEYMMGSRQMPHFPVALSLLTSFLSGVLMLGIPAEVFQRGAHIWMNFAVGAIASLVTAVVFLPVFYKIKCTCLHEYFIHRYNSKVIRQCFSIIFLVSTLVYMSVVIYAPSVSMSKVAGVEKWVLILIFGATATLYTTVGGIKAVVWTDSLQAMMMYGGVIALIWKGLTNERVGGIGRVWTLAVDSGRMGDIFHMSPTILQYNSFWINLLGGTVTWLACFGVNQLSVQRYNSLPSLSNARSIVYTTIAPFLLLITIVSFIGLLMLAYFYECNPLHTGEIADQDQLTMLFAFRMLSETPGLFGLYLACIMSASLSTLSSGINSSAAAIYEDFLKHRLIGLNVTDRQATHINRALVLSIGVLSTGLSFCAEPLGGILRVCMAVMGALSGPMVGIFVLALFWPRAGPGAALTAFLLSSVLCCVVCIANYVEDPYRSLLLPTNSTAEGCGALLYNTTSSSSFIHPPSPPPSYDAHFGDPYSSPLARISIYAYSGLGMVLLLVIGVPLSYLWREELPSDIDHLTFWGRGLPIPEGVLKAPPASRQPLLIGDGGEEEGKCAASTGAIGE